MVIRLRDTPWFDLIVESNPMDWMSDLPSRSATPRSGM